MPDPTRKLDGAPHLGRQFQPRSASPATPAPHGLMSHDRFPGANSEVYPTK